MKRLLPLFTILFLTLVMSGVRAAEDPQAPIQVQNYTAPIRVACVGDSITAGFGSTNNALFSYPSQLKRMLDDKWDVRNFGVSGRTLLNSGDHPYQIEPAFQAALQFKPDVVVIMLGTNDTKPQNWKFKDKYVSDYKELVDKFKAANATTRVFVCLPVPVPGAGNYGINEAGVEEEMPMIQGLAKTENLGVIDLHTALSGHDDLFPDRVHPKNEGAFLMAATVYKTLTGTEFTTPYTPVVTSDWGGFKCTNFEVDGHFSLVVAPNQPAPGNPWIWRTEQFGPYPQVDVALLNKGYFVVYTDLAKTYGAPVALDQMDKFYDAAEKQFQLAPKTVLEAFSHGGLSAFNWAARHPDRVACIYADAPTCDFKSWPGGKGRIPGSPNDWANLKRAYGFKTDDEALAYALNPVDNLKPLADAKIPIIAVYGDDDKEVANDENILVLEKRYKALGGEIQTIARPATDRQAHGLKDVTPIVGFVLAHQS